MIRKKTELLNKHILSLSPTDISTYHNPQILRYKITDKEDLNDQESDITFLSPQARFNSKNQSFQHRKKSKLSTSSSLHQILPRVFNRDNSQIQSNITETQVLPSKITKKSIQNKNNSVNLITESNNSLTIYQKYKKNQEDSSQSIIQQSKALHNKHISQHSEFLQRDQITKKKVKNQNISNPQILKQLLDQKKVLELISNNRGQPSQQKEKNYYNKWYVPYEKRFFEQRQNQQNKYQEIFLKQEALKQDPNLIYNSIQDEKINFYENPFDLVPSKNAIEQYEQLNKRNKYKDLFRSNKILLEQLEKLDKSKFRVPKFLQNLELKKME